MKTSTEIMKMTVEELFQIKTIIQGVIMSAYQRITE